MGTAKGEGACDATDVGSGQYQRVALASRGRHHHDDLGHTRHVSGDGVHQHAARVGRFSTRHIDACAVNGGHLLAKQRALSVAIAPTLAHGFKLGLVVGANARGGGLQGVALRGGQAVKRLFEFGLRQLQRRHVVRTELIPARGVLQYSGIAPTTHIGQDGGDLGNHRGVSLCRDV